MKSKTWAVILMGLCLLGSTLLAADVTTPPGLVENRMAVEFMTPPREAQPGLYYWWLNGNVSKEGITRDFEEMRKHGIGGGIGGVCMTDGGHGGPEVPLGPAFMSEPWRELFRHALKEAARCGIKLQVNICSGWDAGGPWVTPEHAAKKLISSETVVQGPGKVTVDLPEPRNKDKYYRGYKYYRDVAVLAAPFQEQAAPSLAPSPEKSAPSTEKSAAIPDKQRLWQRDRMVNLTGQMDAQGRLTWDVPPGKWQVLRIGYALGGWRTKNPGSGPAGLEIDPMSAEAMDMHFAETGAKMIADAGPLAGKTLQYLHMDSWEIEVQPTWTPAMTKEFQKRQSYDLLPYLPAILDWKVDDDATTERFLRDYRRVVADLMVENYYGRVEQLAIRGGLCGSDLQSGGPFLTPWIDALQAMGASSIVEGEFWYRQVTTMKQSSSAAHIYGRKLVQAEAFTSMGACNFTEGPWNQKGILDDAFCDGTQNMLINIWYSQAQPDTRPGVGYNHICPDFSYKQTWWPLVDGWLTYITRCQYMLRKGVFVADFAFLRNEIVPDFPYKNNHIMSWVKRSGCDADWINADALCRRATAKDGRLVLPDGMSYRYLILPESGYLSESTLKHINALAEAGVPVISPITREGLSNKVLVGDRRKIAPGLTPDCTGAGNWIHRREGDVDIYFVVCKASSKALTFNVVGKQPELWDPVTGNIRNLPEFTATKEGLTQVPLRLETPQSFFVVFQKKTADGRLQTTDLGRKNFPEIKPVMELTGPWEVAFDAKWFYAGGETTDHRLQTADSNKVMVVFENLEDWTKRTELAIKYYSGIATYRNIFSLTSDVCSLSSEALAKEGLSSNLFLDVGNGEKMAGLRLNGQMAGVRLNGRDLGTVWCAPWRVAIPAGLLKDKGNQLEIDVANLWINRLIGDQSFLPKEQRRTQTTLHTWETPYPKFEEYLWSSQECTICTPRKKSGKPPELLPSGLLGPVRVMAEE